MRPLESQGNALTIAPPALLAAFTESTVVTSLAGDASGIQQLLKGETDRKRRLGSGVAAWRSGNIVGRINEVTLRRARLVLGWVTGFGG